MATSGDDLADEVAELTADECRRSKLKASKYLKIMEGLKKNIGELMEVISKSEKNFSQEWQPQFRGKNFCNPFKDAWEEYVRCAPRFSRQMSILFVRMDPSGIPVPTEYVMKYWGNPIKKDCPDGERLWELIISNLGETGYFHKHCYMINCSPLYFVGDVNPDGTSNDGEIANAFISLDDLSDLKTNSDCNELITNIDSALIKAIYLMNPELIIPIGKCASEKVESLIPEDIRKEKGIQIGHYIPPPSDGTVDNTWMGKAWEILTKNAGREKKALDLANSLRRGATIAGLVYEDGVILGADTRDTEGRKLVDDIGCSEIHHISSNIYSSVKKTGNIIASNLYLWNPSLHRLNTGNVKSPLSTAGEMLKECLSHYQRPISEHPSTCEGHVNATMVFGGVENSEPYLSSITTPASTKELEYFIIGSRSLAGIATLKAGYRSKMKKEKAMILVRDTLAGGIFKDLGSGSNVDLFRITKDNKLECLLPYQSVRVKYRKIMNRLKNDLEESLKAILKADGSLQDGIEVTTYNHVIVKYIVNPLKYDWKQQKMYIKQMPSKVHVLFVGMNPARAAPSSIPFADKKMIEEILGIDVPKQKGNEIPAFLQVKRAETCHSAERFMEFIEYHFRDRMEEFRNNCFVMNVSPLCFVGKGGKEDASIEKLCKTEPVLSLIDISKEALTEAIELMNPKLIVALGRYAETSVLQSNKAINRSKSKKRKNAVIYVEHPSTINRKTKTNWIEYVIGEVGAQIDEAIGKAQ